MIGPPCKNGREMSTHSGVIERTARRTRWGGGVTNQPSTRVQDRRVVFSYTWRPRPAILFPSSIDHAGPPGENSRNVKALRSYKARSKGGKTWRRAWKIVQYQTPGTHHVEMPAGRTLRIKPRNFFGANCPAPTAHDVFTYVLHDYIAIMYSSE